MESSTKAVDRVRPVAVLEEGERGQVFVGVDDLLRRRLVVKRMSSGALPSVDMRTRMIHEARVLSRLDHANVLRVYDYSEQGEHDVFTFEYLEGTRLADALEDGLDFGTKVRVATVVASVLSVTHRNGLVHGRLSPQSVVIAADGEVKVVDFHSISTSLDSVRGDSRWCSPEELRGAQTTRESDMYRFGLLLQEMFGTKDRGVRALVAALLCDAPSDRLTAAAALQRLQRLAGRRARRFRIAAAVLLIAIVTLAATKFTLDLKRERALALAARAEEEARRAEANELVAFMVQDLRPKLFAVGKFDIMDATSRKAFEYFASIDPGRISAAEVAINVQAIALYSQVQWQKNDIRVAENAARKALALAESGLRRYPNDLAILFARATAHSSYAMMLTRKGDLPQAFAHANAWLDACNDLVRRKPGDIRFLQFQASAYVNLGRTYESGGDVEASFRNTDIAATGMRRLLERDPSDEWRVKLLIIERFAGTSLIKMGRYGEARRRLERARAEADSILRRKPSDTELLDTRAGHDDQLATAALATGDLETARRHANAQLTASRRLVAVEPARFRFTVLLLMAHRSLGIIARMSGDFEAALRHHLAAIDAANARLARGSEEVVLPRQNAGSRVELARSLLAVGRPGQALLQAGMAVEVCKAIPQEAAARMVLAEALLVRGEALAAQGHRVAANAAWEDTLQAVASIRTHPADPRAIDTQARALLHLARLDRAIPRIEQLTALGYRNREFEALCKEKGAFINPREEEDSFDARRSETPPASKTRTR